MGSSYCRAEPAVTPATETVIFPQYELIEGEWAALTSAIAGDLVEVDGCLRIDNRYGTSYLVIWGPLYELASSGEVLQIRDGTTGQVVARVGEAVHMGGGEGGEETEDLRTGVMPVTEETVQAVEASGCPGPYWYGGEIILSPTSSCELPYVPGTGVIPATPYPEDATIIENEGFVCFYPTPDSSFNVQLSAAGCHASHCTIVYERTGDVEVDLDTSSTRASWWRARGVTGCQEQHVHALMTAAAPATFALIYPAYPTASIGYAWAICRSGS